LPTRGDTRTQHIESNVSPDLQKQSSQGKA
jgi:hypothetical protein